MDKKKHQVILQPFSNTVTENHWLEFPCSECSHTVKATSKVQREMLFGGLGHLCGNCDTYFALLNCPSCNGVTGFSDKEWDLLTKPEGVSCPNCDANLFRVKNDLGITLSGSGALVPTLKNWTNSEEERKYLAYLRTKFNENEQIKIATRHHSVDVRINTAKVALDYLKTNKWYSPLVMSNTSFSGAQNENKTPFDYDFHSNLFSFINNLRSALDILSQEIAVVRETGSLEHNVEFLKFNTYLKDNESLKEFVSEFKESESFIYLNKLRNVLQHRKIPIVVTKGDYEMDKLDTIRPASICSIANIRLPDDPYKSEEDFTFTNNLELFSFLITVMSHTEKFIIDIYSRLTLVETCT